MKLPLVSICIPTFNGAKYLEEALESIEKQTYQNFEVVVSDDASQDSTLEIVRKFKKKIDSPVTITSHKPSGIGANWNNCVKYAKGIYIKFLFQDDILEPTCIEEMVNLAETDNEIGMVYCKRSFLFEEGKKRYENWLRNYKDLHIYWKGLHITEGVIVGKTYLKDRNIFSFPENKIGEPTAVLLRKECFVNIGGFSTSFKQALDIEYWLRVMKVYKIGFIDKRLVYFRLHKEQATQINKTQGIQEGRLLLKFQLRNLFWDVHPKVAWKLLKDSIG